MKKHNRETLKVKKVTIASLSKDELKEALAAGPDNGVNKACWDNTWTAYLCNLVYSS